MLMFMADLIAGSKSLIFCETSITPTPFFLSSLTALSKNRTAAFGAGWCGGWDSRTSLPVKILGKRAILRDLIGGSHTRLKLFGHDPNLRISAGIRAQQKAKYAERLT